MSRILVIGGIGYAGSAIVAEAARRGHEVTSFSRSKPAALLDSVSYVAGDAAEPTTIQSIVDDAEVVVSALSPRGPLAETFREINRGIARATDSIQARLFIVGGFSSLRPAAGAPRFVENPANVPEVARIEVLAGAALIMDDLPAAPATLDWVFVSPAMRFGVAAPGTVLGTYRLGSDVAVDPAGGAISAQDYAMGFVDLIEQDDHHREQVNLAD